MRRASHLFCLVTILISAAPGGAVGQQAERLDVLLSAFSYLRPQLPDGPVMLDFEYERVEAPRDLASIMGRIVNARVGSMDSVIVCRATNDCDLPGVGAVVTLMEPHIVGDTAIVKMFWYFNPARGHIAAEYYTLELKRSKDGWDVSRILDRKIT